MTELGAILILPAILLLIGLLFIAQYKLAIKERKWMMFIIPALILLTFIGSLVLVLRVTSGYQVTFDLVGKDGHGNNLKITVELPQKGDTITRFSNLMIYDNNNVLVDEMHLFYDNNIPEMNGRQEVYDQYIQQMLNKQIQNGAKLDGTSIDLAEVTDGKPFMGGTIILGDPVKFLAIMFGIPFVLILFAGLLPRFLNRKKIRSKALAKMDIQFLDASNESKEK